MKKIFLLPLFTLGLFFLGGCDDGCTTCGGGRLGDSDEVRSLNIEVYTNGLDEVDGGSILFNEGREITSGTENFYGTANVELQALASEGYQFNGWYIDNKNFIEDFSSSPYSLDSTINLSIEKIDTYLIANFSTMPNEEVCLIIDNNRDITLYNSSSLITSPSMENVTIITGKERVEIAFDLELNRRYSGYLISYDNYNLDRIKFEFNHKGVTYLINNDFSYWINDEKSDAEMEWFEGSMHDGFRRKVSSEGTTLRMEKELTLQTIVKNTITNSWTTLGDLLEDGEILDIESPMLTVNMHERITDHNIDPVYFILDIPSNLRIYFPNE